MHAHTQALQYTEHLLLHNGIFEGIEVVYHHILVLDSFSVAPKCRLLLEGAQWDHPTNSLRLDPALQQSVYKAEGVQRAALDCNILRALFAGK